MQLGITLFSLLLWSATLLAIVPINPSSPSNPMSFHNNIPPSNTVCKIKHNVIILFDARTSREAFKDQISLMKDFVYQFLKLRKKKKYPMYSISALQYDACSYQCYKMLEKKRKKFQFPDIR